MSEILSLNPLRKMGLPINSTFHCVWGIGIQLKKFICSFNLLHGVDCMWNLSAIFLAIVWKKKPFVNLFLIFYFGVLKCYNKELSEKEQL